MTLCLFVFGKAKVYVSLEGKPTTLISQNSNLNNDRTATPPTTTGGRAHLQLAMLFIGVSTSCVSPQLPLQTVTQRVEIAEVDSSDGYGPWVKEDLEDDIVPTATAAAAGEKQGTHESPPAGGVSAMRKHARRLPGSYAKMTGRGTRSRERAGDTGLIIQPLSVVPLSSRESPGAQLAADGTRHSAVPRYNSSLSSVALRKEITQRRRTPTTSGTSRPARMTTYYTYCRTLIHKNRAARPPTLSTSVYPNAVFD